MSDAVILRVEPWVFVHIQIHIDKQKNEILPDSYDPYVPLVEAAMSLSLCHGFADKCKVC